MSQVLSLVGYVPGISRANTLRAELYLKRQKKLCDLRHSQLQQMEAYFFQNPKLSSPTGFGISPFSRVFECRLGKIWHWYCSEKKCHILLRFKLNDETRSGNTGSDAEVASPDAGYISGKCARRITGVAATLKVWAARLFLGAYMSSIGAAVISDVSRVGKVAFASIYKLCFARKEESEFEWVNTRFGAPKMTAWFRRYELPQPENETARLREAFRQLILSYPEDKIETAIELERCSNHVFDRYRQSMMRGRRLAKLARIMNEQTELAPVYSPVGIRLCQVTGDDVTRHMVYRDCVWARSLVMKVAEGRLGPIGTPHTLSTVGVFEHGNDLDEWKLFVVGNELKLRFAEVLAHQLTTLPDTDEFAYTEGLLHRCARLDKFSTVVDRFFGLEMISEYAGDMQSEIAEIVMARAKADRGLRNAILHASTFGSWIMRLHESDAGPMETISPEFDYGLEGDRMLRLAADILNIDPKKRGLRGRDLNR